MMRRRLMGGEAPDEYIRFADPEVERICVANWGDGVGLTYKAARNITSLGGKFSGNKQITSFDELRYFTGLVSLGDSEFNECSALTTIYLGNLLDLGEASLRSCPLAGDLFFPKVISYGNRVLANDANVTSLRLPSVENLGISEQAYLFNDCHTLHTLDFGEKLSKIYQYGMCAGCYAITSVIFRSTAPPDLASVSNGSFFYGVSSDFKVYVADSSIDEYKIKFQGLIDSYHFRSLSEYAEP